MKRHILTDKVRGGLVWLVRQPPVMRLRQRYPKAATFITDRFNTNYFVGLPLTLIVLAVLLNLVLLSNLAESVVEAEWVVQVDKRLNDLLYSIRSEWVSRVFYTITWLGDRQAVFVLGGLATIVLLLRRRWAAIIAFWVAMGGAGLSVRFGKKIISRDRPVQDMAYYIVDHFSFPSGHSTTAIALIGMLVYFLYRQQEAPLLRRLMVVVGTILVMMVGFSRMYLGVHYFSDVLAGFLLGGLWLLVGISIVEVMEYHKQRSNNLR